VTRCRPGPDQSTGGPEPERIPLAVDYRSLAERAPAILYRYRLLPHPKMDYINPAVTETLGYTPEDFYCDPDLVLAVLDVPKLAVAAEPDPGVSGRPIVRRWRRRDGTYADVEERTIAIRDRDGNVEAIEGVARDVSAELAIRQELRASRDRLDAVVSHMPVILWATDRE
jgi:PAS domain-containing protein